MNRIILTLALALLSTAMMAATPITGKKKALVILVEFTDVKFQKEHTKELYEQILNGKDFKNDMGFVGSVNDYFRAMSDGQFEFDFDIVGPEMLPNRHSWYGKDENGASDKNVATMIAQACQYVDEDFPEINFADYDADGDGTVDLVAVIYAGQGQNASYEANAADMVWPHEGKLSGTFSSHKPITLDGVKVDDYACSCELNVGKKIDGIGVLCHEFSHTIGLHDMYDTSGNGYYGMSIWSIMDMGNYLGAGYIPISYSAYERMACGWKQPIVLNNDTTVANMRPIADGGDTYIIYNDAHANEYYLLENRQPVGWDAGLNYGGTDYGRGLIITHVDYSKEVWDANNINSTAKQRCTIFHADNSDGKTQVADVKGDPYPYTSTDGLTILNNVLTNTSAPAATLNNANKDGAKLMNKSITDITQNADGTISFKFANNNGTGIRDIITSGNGLNNGKNARIHTLDGRFVGTDLNALPKGIYIIGGKKIVK